MEVSLLGFLKMIKKNLAVLIILAILGFVGVFSYSEFCMQKKYVSDFRMMLVSTASKDANVTQAYNAFAYMLKVGPSAYAMFQGDSLAKDVRQELSLSYMPSITFSYAENETVFNVTIKCNTQRDAYDVACRVSEIVKEKIENTFYYVKVTSVVDPVMPVAPSEPRPIFNGFVGAVGLAVLFILFLLVKDLYGAKIKSSDELKERYGIPVIAVVPDFSFLKSPSKKSSRESKL